MNDYFSYWIVPAEPIRTELRNLIARLAERFDTVQFEPHVTVYSGKSEDQEVERNVHLVAKSFKPIALVPQSVEFSQALTKTLFVQFAPSSALQDMSDHLATNSHTQSGYELNPHVSLLYRMLPDDVLRQLADTTTIPRGLYEFNTLQVIAAERPPTTIDDIRHWTYTHQLQLRG